MPGALCGPAHCRHARLPAVHCPLGLPRRRAQVRRAALTVGGTASARQRRRAAARRFALRQIEAKTTTSRTVVKASTARWSALTAGQSSVSLAKVQLSASTLSIVKPVRSSATPPRNVWRSTSSSAAYACWTFSRISERSRTSLCNSAVFARVVEREVPLVLLGDRHRCEIREADYRQGEGAQAVEFDVVQAPGLALDVALGLTDRFVAEQPLERVARPVERVSDLDAEQHPPDLLLRRLPGRVERLRLDHARRPVEVDRAVVLEAHRFAVRLVRGALNVWRSARKRSPLASWSVCSPWWGRMWAASRASTKSQPVIAQRSW